MAAGYTGYPRITRWPHMAPALGAQPIPGFARPIAVPGYAQGAPQPAQSPDSGFSGLGTAIDPDTATAPLSPANTPSEVLPEAFLGIGTAALSGAITGGVAAGSMRGAGIGASLNMGLWSMFTVLGSWRDLPTLPRNVLLVTTGVGLLGAAALYWTRQ